MTADNPAEVTRAWRVVDAAGSAQRALSFGTAAAGYQLYRPGYPPEAIQFVVGDSGSMTVLDLGAGTGKLTAALVASGSEVIAVEPDPEMLSALRTAVPQATALAGSAEQIPLPDASVDVITVGQAMHWFDLDQALVEMARVLRPAGRLAALWNVDDVDHPFTAAFQREKDLTVRPVGGATGRSDRQISPPFTDHEEFTDPVVHSVRWRRAMTPEQLHGLLDTLSYVIAADAENRTALHSGVDRLIAGCDDPLELAETCQVWVAQRR
ncbi:MAG: class I SAM-dependent methyltransferase [Actinomycetota bacterium]|nr:class I SAM-dependent methyltransferase [Actinomycetota bacterium]